MRKIIVCVLTGVVALGAAAYFLFPSNTPNPAVSSNTEQPLDSVNRTTTSESEIAEIGDGAIVTEIDKHEYLQLAKHSCDAYLSNDSTHFNMYPDSLVIRTKNGTLTLLNRTYDEEAASDFCIEWQYDGYKAESRMSFFSFSVYEGWGYYVVSEAGAITRFQANRVPVFCKLSNDLFATMFLNPYENANSVNIYKILPDGRLSEIAIIEMGESDSIDVLSWVGEKCLIATKRQQNHELACLRIDLTDKVLKTNTPLPLATPQEYNETVLALQHQLPNDSI